MATEFQVVTEKRSGLHAVELHPWAAYVDRNSTWYTRSKPAVDFMLALALLLIFSPVILVAAFLVKLTSRGPAFYSQVRLGRHGRHFAVHKLRTMVDNAERLSGPCWAKAGDRRVTPLGRFLRRSHIDELPQLWNVLRGEMSLIGPRPERPEFAPTLVREIPDYLQRLQVRPGVTGLAQVQLPPDTDLESVRQKLACDLCYVEKVSPGLDLRILCATVGHVLGMSGDRLRKLFGLPNARHPELLAEEANGHLNPLSARA